MLISRSCPWASMKRGGCKFGGCKTGAVNAQKGRAVVSQLVPKLEESVPPPGYRPLSPPPPTSGKSANVQGWESGVAAPTQRPLFPLPPSLYPPTGDPRPTHHYSTLGNQMPPARQQPISAQRLGGNAATARLSSATQSSGITTSGPSTHSVLLPPASSSS